MENCQHAHSHSDGSRPCTLSRRAGSCSYSVVGCEDFRTLTVAGFSVGDRVLWVHPAYTASIGTALIGRISRLSPLLNWLEVTWPNGRITRHLRETCADLLEVVPVDRRIL